MFTKELNKIDTLFDPFNIIDDIERTVEGFFNPDINSYPLLNSYIKDDKLLIVAELPGVKAEDLEISISDDLLTIKGKREDEGIDEDAYIRRERSYGEFERKIKLPFRVDEKKVEATLRDGILKLSLEEKEEDKPKKISVKTN